ncbi:MAG: CDP-glycerol glycerophosphotransferase family protein [Sporolactobacillus sp.]|jgi:CDP-glycerol glycerophosphotransferase (TagB/SpsB family)|nr:CDP-glycerol glycerophosphotransferase family protein [Sporolactobacillus sp.]
MEKIILFGASTLGRIAYEKLKRTYAIRAFSDNDQNKVGKACCGLKIISPQVLKEHPECCIMITSQYYISIAQQLFELGIKHFSLFEQIDGRFLINDFDYRKIKSFKVEKNKICLIITNYSGSNSYALYRYLEFHHSEKLNVVKVDEAKKDPNYFYKIFTSKVIVRTHEGPYLKDKINIQLWHGFPLKGMSYMSKNENQNKEFNHNEWTKFNLITSYSQLYNDLMSACYGVDINQFVITGMPRNDLLIASNGTKHLEKIMGRSLKKSDKVIFYMPTFRGTVYGEKNGNERGYIFNAEDFNLEDFNHFCLLNNILFIIKVHPMDYGALSKILDTHLSNIFLFPEINAIDFYEVLNASDLLITDYSSVFFDYLLLDRPIIFCPNDLKEYQRNRGLLLQPYDFWTPGPKAFNTADLKKEITHCLEDTHYYAFERKLICNLVHQFKDGHASERVINVFKHYVPTEGG